MTQQSPDASISEEAKAFLHDAKSYIEVKGNYIAHADKVVTNNYASGCNVYTGEKKREYVSPVSACKEAIVKLLDDNMLVDMQDYCCLFRLDNEMCAVGFLSIPDFIDRLRSFLPEDMQETKLPNANQMRGLDFGKGVFPNWKWENFGEKSRPHLMALCNAYIAYMASRGFYHPSLNARQQMYE